MMYIHRLHNLIAILSVLDSRLTQFVLLSAQDTFVKFFHEDFLCNYTSAPSCLH